MATEKFVIRFPGHTIDEQNKLAKELADSLHSDVRDLQKVEPLKESDNTMDFGSAVVLILGTASATAVAHGLRNFLARFKTRATLSADGTVVIENIASKDVPEVAKALKG